MKKIATVLFVLCFSLFGCGARSELMVPVPSDAFATDAAEDSIARDAPVDLAPSDEGGADTAVDAATATLRVYLSESPSDPQSEVFIAGSETWHPVTVYNVCQDPPGGPTAWIDRIRVHVDGDPASYSGVAIGDYRRLFGQGVLPPSSSETDVPLAEPIAVAGLGCSGFWIWVRMAPVVPCATSPCNVSGTAHSGYPIGATVATGETGSPWDARYAGQANIRATTEAGRSVIGPVTLRGARYISVVHRTQPTIRVLNIGAGLYPGDGRLLPFNITADPAGPVSFKQVTYSIRFNRITGMVPVISRFQFLRNGTPMADSAYRILDEAGTDIRNTGLDPMRSEWHVSVVLTNEERVDVTGQDYQLAATITNDIRRGDELVTSFWRDAVPFGTYYLTGEGPAPTPPHYFGMNLDWGNPTIASATGFQPTGHATSGCDFCWSDLSEVPHSDQPGGSRDWMPFEAIQTNYSSQRLTAP